MSKCETCATYDNEKHYCPMFCEVIKNTVDDVRAEAIEEMVSLLTSKEIAQTYDFDDVLCNGNYDANFNDFRNYVRSIANMIKEKNE